MHHAYVSSIMLATVFSMAWYKIDMQCSLVVYTMEYPTSHLYFLGLHTSLKAHVYTKKIHMTSLNYMYLLSCFLYFGY